MHRFYIAAENWNLDSLQLDEAESHHALDVLRLKQGDRTVVFNGRGVEATVEIAGIRKNGVDLRRVQHAKFEPLACRITLAQAIPKGKAMELIVQKATELGVAAIAPLLSERTVIQYAEGEIEKKREKWQAVAIEAAKQCGQNWLPAIERPQSLKDFFNAGARYDLTLIASLQPDSQHFKMVFAEHLAVHKKKPADVLILVGPEGDFTPAEIALAKSLGCRPITLGPIVLRTETAAIYCLSVLSYELLNPVA